MDDDVIICRCEDTTRREIEAAIRAGALDIDSVKKMTRAGMGSCQGSVCEQLVLQILRDAKAPQPALFRKRPPVAPITLEGIASTGDQEP